MGRSRSSNSTMVEVEDSACWAAVPLWQLVSQQSTRGRCFGGKILSLAKLESGVEMDYFDSSLRKLEFQ